MSYIKVYQAIRQHWLWEQPRYLKWWLDLLMLAEWRDVSKRVVCNGLYDIRRGQLTASVRYLRDRWEYRGDDSKLHKPTERTIHRFLQMLEAEEMIKIDVETLPRGTTLITILNYDKYQGFSTAPTHRGDNVDDNGHDNVDDNGHDNVDDNGHDNVDDNGHDNVDDNKLYNNITLKENIKIYSLSKNEFSNLENQFEEFRKAYPGTKRGHETEFTDFKRKHKNWAEIVPKLMPSLERLIAYVEAAKAAGQWVAQYANLKTWLNQSRWEDELPDTPPPAKKTSKGGCAPQVAAEVNYDEEIDAFKSKNRK